MSSASCQHFLVVAEERRFTRASKRSPGDTASLDNPWQESYVALDVASEAEYECVQAPCSHNFQPQAALQV
jgi:hypothetical protein